MELLFLALFAASLIACVVTGASVVFALIFGYILFFSYGLIHGKSVKEMLRFSRNGIFTVKNVLLTLLLISMLTAIWRACGSIAYIVYYASAICTPSVMLLASFLLCCLISFLTGTSFGSAATIGVICMTMANSMGIPPFLTGGAILAGIFFGDRCSPVSTSALLVSELTKTDLFFNIRNMTRIAGGDPEKKIYKLMEFTGSGRDVADPRYTGDFEATYRDVSEGCQALLEKLKGNLAS